MNIFQYANTQSEDTWFVENLIGEGHICTIYGQAGSGKSHLAWFIAQAASDGDLLLNTHKVKKTKCLIIDEETPEWDLKDRAKLIFHKESNVDIFLRPERGFNFGDNNQIQRLIETIKSEKPGLIIFDNLNALHGILKLEESNTDVSKLRTILAHLQEQNPGMTIIIIHHEGKDKNKGMRGASALHDMTASELRVEKVNSSPFQFVVEPIARKRKVIKPFLVQLDKTINQLKLTHLGYLESQVFTPTEEAVNVMSCFYLRKGTKTIKSLREELMSKIEERDIRKELKILVSEGMLIEDHKCHNEGYFELNPQLPEKNVYVQSILKALKSRNIEIE
jgi:ABC-type oligopeptide transport system ATPase subunit